MRHMSDGGSIRDAVHGDIQFSAEEMALIQTAQFQRLKGIKQLGLAHLIYPGAQHTRYEHSLGVTQMSTRIFQAVQDNGAKLSPRLLGLVRALALVHDIGHLPFGHTLEDERPIFRDEDRHDESSRLKHLL